MLTELAKFFVPFLGVVAALGTAHFWASDPRDGPGIWIGRIVCIVVLAAVLGLGIWATTRKERAPDLLRRINRRPFEHDGFQFAVVPVVRANTCYLDVYYQNRFERPCRAVVALKPVRGVIVGPPKLHSFSLPIECPGGAFGVLRVPWAIPLDVQGRRWWVEVGARVQYPDGSGPALRLRAGRPANPPILHSLLWGHGLGLLLHFFVPKRTLIKLALPIGVWEMLPADAQMENEVLWVPGQPVPPDPRSQ